MNRLDRDFFQIQLDFVDAIVAKHKITASEAYFQHTSFYVRCLGFSDKVAPSAENPKWLDLLHRLEEDPKNRAESIYSEYMKYESSQDELSEPTSCFHTFYHQVLNKYELHLDPVDPLGNLSSSRKLQRLQELKKMFEDIASEKRKDATLFVNTWLLGLEAFDRLFPLAFSQKATYWQNGNRQTHNAHWGQFIDKNKQLKKEIVRTFERNYRETNHEDFNRYFPHPAKYVELPLTTFFDFYKNV